MIRFPERFHASVTPGAGFQARYVEANYQERGPMKTTLRAQLSQPNENQPKFDFTAIETAFGARHAR